jgi:hypothetical protein
MEELGEVEIIYRPACEEEQTERVFWFSISDRTRLDEVQLDDFVAQVTIDLPATMLHARLLR